MDIFEVENQINSLDKIKLQKLISWLTHTDLAVSVLLFSEITKKNILDNTSSNGRIIIEEQVEKYQDEYEDLIPALLKKIDKYIDLIIAGKSIVNIDDE